MLHSSLNRVFKFFQLLINCLEEKYPLSMLPSFHSPQEKISTCEAFFIQSLFTRRPHLVLRIRHCCKRDKVVVVKGPACVFFSPAARPLLSVPARSLPLPSENKLNLQSPGLIIKKLPAPGSISNFVLRKRAPTISECLVVLFKKCLIICIS